MATYSRVVLATVPPRPQAAAAVPACCGRYGSSTPFLPSKPLLFRTAPRRNGSASVRVRARERRPTCLAHRSASEELPVPRAAAAAARRVRTRSRGPDWGRLEPAFRALHLASRVWPCSGHDRGHLSMLSPGRPVRPPSLSRAKGGTVRTHRLAHGHNVGTLHSDPAAPVLLLYLARASHRTAPQGAYTVGNDSALPEPYRCTVLYAHACMTASAVCRALPVRVDPEGP
ncbi:hypothetical protein GY45DRAFT_17736 [Cubamyces sp. BRFM 1775]|nr:hypothetical protein GY45DRAFT_17736 [Cubamyces sp. BRFM 1775]